MEDRMSRMSPIWAAFAAVTIVIVGCERTDKPAPEQPAVGSGGAGANLKDDDDFVRDVASTNMAQIELSRMALQKAANPDIKAFAQRVIDDHGAAAEKLKSVIAGNQSGWPAQLDEKHRKTAGELAEKQGADFEHEYAEAMVEGQQDLAAKLESRLDVQSVAEWKTAAGGRARSQAMPDPNTTMRDIPLRPSKSDNATTTKINQWAADTYPVTQKHLDTARALETATKKRDSR
jgi:putative membrane protein